MKAESKHDARIGVRSSGSENIEVGEDNVIRQWFFSHDGKFFDVLQFKLPTLEPS